MPAMQSASTVGTVSGPDFIGWLESIRCTSPFTIVDAKELHRIIHEVLTPWPDTVVDVYTTSGDVVHVRVETYRGVIKRDFDVV